MTGSFICEIGNVRQRKLPTEPETALSPEAAVDSDGVEFDVEVQRNTKGSHVRRARYHQSMINSKRTSRYIM